MAAIPVAALYFAIDIDAFASVARGSLPLPIQWQTVASGQLYGLWALTAAYLSIGVIALYYLFRAFRQFADGAWFTADNSRSLKRFAILLFAQACLQPIYGGAASVILSLNHPAGQKVLSLSIGSNELRTIAIAMILWVVSEILLKGRALEDENKAFV
jgi:heme A synthase